MQAYVIKNKEGKMLCWHCECGYYFDHFNYRSLSYMEIGNKKEIKTTFNSGEFDNVDCTIVPITIAEGDLEEENRVLKSKLYEIWYNFTTIGEVCVTESKKEISSENAVEEIRNYLTDIDLCFDEIKEKLGTDYFIKQAKGEER